MSTQSNRKWARIDKRRVHADELLVSWINGNRSHVLKQLGYHGQDETGKGRGIVRGRLLAALVCTVLDHGDRLERVALGEICEAVYREL